jgi:hypothetical protein
MQERASAADMYKKTSNYLELSDKKRTFAANNIR